MASSVVSSSPASSSSISISSPISVPVIVSLTTRQQQQQQQNSLFDEIEEIESNNDSQHEQHSQMMMVMSDSQQDLQNIEYSFIEPIIIRGNGNITLFGLSNTFASEFPSSLLGRVSREEFESTIGRVNHLLRSHHSTNSKLLLLGCLCCCCSFGCSLLWPTLALSKRTRTALEKLLTLENQKLYHKLGLNWKLSKERCHGNHSFMEYVLLIEFLPKLNLYQPD